jgi:hypothetical protein
MAEFEPEPGDLYQHFQGQIDDIYQRIMRTAGSSDLRDAIAALPVLLSGGDDEAGFGLLAGWGNYAHVTLAVPAGKTVATIFATGNAAAVDMTTGGLTSMSGRIVIAGVAGVASPSSKDAGASAVNNVISTGSQRTISGVSGALEIYLQLSPLSSSAFPARPGNIASLAVMASFSN